MIVGIRRGAACAAAVAVMLVLGAPALGQVELWTLIDNFEARNLGPIDGQGAWVANESYQVVATPDPEGSSRSLRAGDPAFDRGYHPLSVPAGADRTLLLRYRVDSDPDAHGEGHFGISHLATPGGTSFDDFKVQIDGGARDLDAGTFRFRIRDGGTFRDVSLSGSEEAVTRFDLDTWYNMWVYVDNATSSFQVWLNEGFLEPNPTQLVWWDGTTEHASFTYRGGAFAGDIQTLLLRRGGYYVDDVFVSPGLNLTIIPEPATMLLLAGGGLLALARRRRR